MLALHDDIRVLREKTLDAHEAERAKRLERAARQATVQGAITRSRQEVL